jgi:hypothetical protein
LSDVYLTMALDRPAEELVSAAGDALRELHEGAALPQASWNIRYQDGATADMSHRAAVRDLAAVAGLRARIRFRDGQPSGAADDLLAAVTAARHLSVDGSLASALIAHTLEWQATTLLAQHLRALPGADLPGLALRVDALPASPTFAAALLAHEAIARRILVGEAQAARDRPDLLARVNALPLLAGRAADIVDACGGTADGLVRCLEVLQGHYREWSQRGRLSPEDFQKAYDAAAPSLADPTAFRLLLPALPRLRWHFAYHDTQRALFRAALAVEAAGVTALARHVDPYDGRQFSHMPTPAGFRLASRLTQGAHALAILVGAPRRE